MLHEAKGIKENTGPVNGATVHMQKTIDYP